ncbi:MAG: DegT/DnrJ/EryC1/StrS family aminotransferase [Paludibacteraceae bacterium]|jgi:UDP-2-acetamido-2-deoxy-ribo-hexuluronate aminotransferase|nr:DegT/DnrJ/EryC1/StrS family aminotransferase [Paludibacteraceae bacterium]OQA48058.1 MAG: UDP-2-acetamido-2-deoxy-3-oxo-D-glucuronate aminotransferase [Bacteroidetes bacterium ADurb.Bin302]
MKKIQMVDLKSQYEKIREDVNNGIQEVIDTTTFIKGGKVNDFQKNLEAYLGVKHVIPTGNGTDALQIALMALGLKPGDEVITPTFTFIATAEVVALLGLKPVVVDVEEDTFNISIESIKKAITTKTKAIVPVHLFGQCANMEAILEIAKEHNLFVVEDACQAIGAEYTFKDGSKKQAGCIGNIGCTSFFPSKNLGCYGDGGAIFTNDDDLAARMRAIANHGMVVQYHHDFVGVNSRLDSIQAAVLNAKLPHLNEYIAARQKAAATYDKAFAGNKHIITPVHFASSTHVFHQYTLKLVGVDRNAVQAKLKEKNVPAMIYYPVPLHLQKAYQDPRYKAGDFPVAEKLSACVLSLPMHTELDDEQMNYITSAVLEAVK